MAEPFKLLIRPETIRVVADGIAGAMPNFDAEGFIREASQGLDDLALKARVIHVAAALRPRLPDDWTAATNVLVRGCGPPLPDATEVSQGFALWPLLYLVEVCGLHDPERSLWALHALTKRFSAEFAVRPYLAKFPDLTWPTLRRWATDPDVHVRRLASEGSRPRLPWGMQLRDAVADPSQGISVITLLKDDDEVYVTRSVANHLNDISRDHPQRALQTADAWLEGATEARRRTVKHAMRTLLKAGNAEALALFGLEAPRVHVEDARAEPPHTTIGGEVTLALTVHARATQDLRVDVHLTAPGARGTTRRTIRGPTKMVDTGDIWALRVPLSLALTTTRTVRPGDYTAAVRINGETVAEITFIVHEA